MLETVKEIAAIVAVCSLHFYGITNGENVRIACAHVLVNADSSAFTNLESRRLGKFCVWPNTDC